MTEPAAARFANPERAADALRPILAVPGGADAVEAVLRSADPDMALLNLARYVEATGALPDPLDDAVLLFAGSQSLSGVAIRSPEVLAAAREPFPPPDGLVAEVARLLAADPADPRPPLRRFVRGMTLRILIDDLAGRTGLAETARRLSRVAEAAIDAALGVALAEAREKYGTPRTADGREATITVLGFGKLGGSELNYSSDIDLVFLYSDDGRTDAVEPARARRNQDFFTRVVARTRALLADPTPEGHCYRVDLRLRPQGSTGGLTRTVRSALEYYERVGRPWERQALLKARPVAGDRLLGERGFLAPLSDFVYGTPLKMEEIGKIQKLKREMERRAGDREVKAGPGGIRDVEFTVQFLQLLHARRHPELRSAGTLPALAALSVAEAITKEEREQLEAAYVFLRTAEHRMQTLHEVRTHRLPAHPEGLARLALRMRLPVGDEDPAEVFQRRHAIHTAAAREILDRLFHNLFLSGSEELARLSDWALAPETNDEVAREWLAAHGFRDPPSALDSLARLATESPRARKFFASLLPHLLLHVADTPDPDRALRNLTRIVLALGAPATLYQMFSRYPDIMSVFTDISGWSQFLADLLALNPGMLDAFVDSLVVSEVEGRLPMDDLPLSEIESVPDPAALLHDYLDLALVRIGVRDIQKKANTLNTSGDLTLLAERVLRLALRRVQADLTRKHGAPKPGARTRIAILGLGKLGAREMTWASDLDLVFVGDASGEMEDGLGAAEFVGRVAQGVYRLLTSSGPRGRLYEVDARVRPWGRSGPLVTPLDGFEAYYRNTAHVAELLMLTKARFVAGDEELGAALDAAIGRVLYGGPPRPGAAEAVREMRHKLEEQARGRDVKRGFGGIVDIEFIAEFLRLRHGAAVPPLRTTSTLSAIAAARREGILRPREHETLLTAYQFLRSMESRIRIVYDMAQDRIPEDAEERNLLARRLGYVDTESERAGDALLTEYDYHTRRTREIFEQVLTSTVPGHFFSRPPSAGDRD